MISTAAALCTVLALAPAHPDASSIEPSATGTRDRTTGRPHIDGLGRAGIGFMAAGGVAMVVGAGVLVPVAIGTALGESAPNPANYTAVDPYVQDLAAYRAAIGRSMTLGVAGAVVAVVGATSFTTGAILWGVSRHRARRGSRVSWSVAPGRRSFGATATLRF